MEEATPVVKKTTRTRKTATQAPLASTETTVLPTTLTQVFDDLISKILQRKQEFDNLQKEIAQVKLDWAREQKQHELELIQQKSQEELERKREQETYQYNTNLARKRVEDEFQDKRMSWEKDLAQRKEELEDQKEELEMLRKLSEGFDKEEEQAVKEAEAVLEKQLTEKFNQETILREQEIKAEKEILGLKIANLESENSRLTKEIEILKRSLDEAARQVKEIAVKVIESGSSQIKPQASSQE